MWKDLSDSQKSQYAIENMDRELLAVDDGVARYQRAAEHTELTSPDRQFILKTIEKVSALIGQDQANLLNGMASAGRPHTWAPAYVTMCPDKLALITLTRLMNSVDPFMKLTCKAGHIASRVQTEHQLEEVLRITKQRSKEERGFSKRITDKIRGDTQKIKKLYKKMSSSQAGLRWTPTQRVGLGTRLIMIVVSAGVGWYLTKRMSDKHNTYFVDLADSIRELLDNGEERASLMSALHSPMCVPPMPWTVTDGVVTGGYRYIPTQLVRSGMQSASHNDGLNAATLTEPIEALNAIQNVEWRIDTDTLEFVQRVLDKNNPQWSMLIPVQSVMPTIPPLPKGRPHAEIQVWRQQKTELIVAHRKAASDRLSAYMAVTQARKLVGKPVFFVHSFDWRGRIYPVASALEPQGTDLSKALLRYAEKIPLGKTGLRELKIWAAGCAGHDKVSFDDRVKWWDDNWATGLPIMDDYRWCAYDNPFLFVQAAREIRAAVASGCPEKFLSDISVCVDGSQNGIQHLSALGRDSIGGGSVNLVKTAVPNDLYFDVAELVHSSVVGDAEQLQELGQTTDHLDQLREPLAWLRLLEDPKKRRKLVKRAVLAYPYGVSRRGMSQGLLDTGLTDGIGGSRDKNAWYLAGKIHDAVKDVVISAAQIMDWLRTVAETKARAGQDVVWTTPTGFKCTQHYLKQAERQIEVNDVRLTFWSDTDRIDIQKQIRGLPANFIHSLDASHLVKTCLKMMLYQVYSMQFIHDSFGCHAGRVPLLALTLREEFVKLHSSYGLGEFIKENINPAVDLPPPPDLGDLDIRQVMDSPFFFA